MLNTPMGFLVVVTVAVGVNSFLFFDFYLPRTTTPPPSSPPAQPEQTERTTTTHPTTTVE